MRKLLTIKHWQLFVLLVGVPMIFNFFSIRSAISNSGQTQVFYYFPILMIYFIAIFFGWIYILGVSLYEKLSQNTSMNLRRFKLFLVIPVAYMLFIILFMAKLVSDYHPTKGVPGAFGLIVPLHLFSMFCIFYCIYFIAKALKMAEWQKPVTFNDFAGEFFLFWMFPFGVWILQPRINKLFDASLNDEPGGFHNGDIR